MSFSSQNIYNKKKFLKKAKKLREKNIYKLGFAKIKI